MSWFRPAGYSLACLVMGLFGASATGAPPNTGPNPSSGGFNTPRPSGGGVSLPKASQGGSSTYKPSSPSQSKPQLPKPNSSTAKKPTLPKPAGSTTVKKPTLPKPGGNTTVKKPTLPKPGGSSTVKKPTLPKPGGNTTVKKPTLPKPGGNTTVKKPTLPKPTGNTTVKKPTLPKPGGNTTVKKPTLPKAKLTAAQKLQRQNLASRTLASKQREKLAKMNATERAKHQKAIQDAAKRRLATRRPNTLVSKDVTKVKVSKTTTSDKSRLAQRAGDRRALERSVKDKALLDRLGKGRLTGRDRALLRDRLIAARRLGNFGLLRALRRALLFDLLATRMNFLVGGLALVGDGGSCGCTPVWPGGPGFNFTDETAPPGIDPNAPSTVVPEVPGDDEGTGVVTSVDPESVDQPPEEGVQEEGEETVSLDGVVQTTRNLRLSNGCKKRVKIKIFYTTVNASNEVAEGEAEAELEPGEVVDLQEGEWTVNASSVRFTAEDEDGETKWERFKDTPLNLVPEDDGYVASKPQTLVLALR